MNSYSIKATYCFCSLLVNHELSLLDIFFKSNSRDMNSYSIKATYCFCSLLVNHEFSLLDIFFQSNYRDMNSYIIKATYCFKICSLLVNRGFSLLNVFMVFASGFLILYVLSNSYTMGCPPVRGDIPWALASGLSHVQVDKHGISILYHLYQCRPCTSWDISC